MPANIEIKARARDFARQRAIAEKLTGGAGELILQKDTFFRALHGRLKLRVLADGHGELIAYSRADATGPKRSQYRICEVKAPQALRATLESALGTLGEVTKKRWLYLYGQTRIHLDEVEGLGSFLELEVVLAPGQSEADGQAIARELMRKLQVDQEDLVATAYLDLLKPAAAEHSEGEG